MLNDSMRLYAAATISAKQVEAGLPAEIVARSFGNVDRDWRLLSYRLQQVPDLPPQCRECIGRLDKYDRSLCSLLKITPAVDRQQLAKLAGAAQYELDHLMEDVELELGRTVQCHHLLAEGQRVRQQTAYVGQLTASGRPYDTLVLEMKKLRTGWMALGTKLRGIPDDHLQRSLLRVDNVYREMAALLWLPQETDYALLKHLTASLVRDTDLLFGQVTLRELVQLRNPGGITRTANEFQGLCENLMYSIDKQSPVDVLADDFYYLEEAWPALASSFAPVRKPAVLQGLRAVEQELTTLRSHFGVPAEFDRKYAGELAAAIENVAQHLLADFTRNIQAQGQYPRLTKNAARQQLQALEAAANHCCESVAAGEDRQHLQADIRLISESWQAYHDGFWNDATPSDQGRIRLLVARLGESTVELQNLVR